MAAKASCAAYILARSMARQFRENVRYLLTQAEAMPGLHKIPIEPSDLTPEWLTFALRSSGTLDAPNAVIAIHSNATITAAGQTGWYVDLQVEYAAPSESLPKGLFVKGIKPSTDLFQQYVGPMFRNEIIFYRDVAPRTPVRVPGYYFGDISADSSSAVLVLEALDQANVGRMTDGLNIDDMRLLLDELAALHGTWWNSGNTVELEWPGDPWADVAKEFYAPKLPDIWDQVKAGMRELTTPQGEELSDLLVTRVTELWERMANTNRSLLQMDAGVNNVAFETVNGRRQAVLFDWICAPGPIAWDVGLAMFPSLRSEDHGAIPALIEHYCLQLARHGVKDYGPDEATKELRLGALAAIAARMFSLSPSIGKDPSEPLAMMRRTGFERSVLAALRMDGVKTLKELRKA